MAISDEVQQMKDELFANLVRLKTAVYARSSSSSDSCRGRSPMFVKQLQLVSSCC